MMLRSIAAAIAAAVITALPLSAQAAAPVSTSADAPVAWSIDTSTSDVTFRIRNLLTRVSGTFDRWTAALRADPDNWEGASVSVSIETASINTRQEKRDGHLRSDDFFDAANHPTITFRSRSVEAMGDKLRIEGDLTIRGITRPVVLDGAVVALTTAPNGARRVGFHATTRIDRNDFGVSWNRAAEGGGVVLADDVDIEIDLAAVAPAP